MHTFQSDAQVELRDKESKTSYMFTGDTGRPGLPGLPGSYTVQVPHRVQKREAGVCLLHVAEPHKKGPL